MNAIVKASIDDLRDLVMELYRSAGQLDEVVRRLEEAVNEEDSVYRDATIIHWAKYREDVAEANEYYELVDIERDLLKGLVTMLSKKD